MEEESMVELLHQYATKLNERVDTLETQLESLTIKTLYGQKPELETKKPELETKKPKKFFGLFGGDSSFKEDSESEEESMEELLYQYLIKLNERVDTLEKNLESLTIKTLYEQKPELETKKPKKRFGLFGGKKAKRRIKYTYGIYTGNY
tara:strand:- start:12349 stop:12795 length:447 start_codon:yes stop_codon:yes gene_type:complete